MKRGRGRALDPVVRFMAHVRVDENGCWMWTGYVAKGSGYGTFRHTTNQNDSQIRAHRFAYQAFKGPIPDGLVVMHRCDVPGCVNPEHLRVGTLSENSIDAVAKGRSRSLGRPYNPEQCVNGHRRSAENTRCFFVNGLARRACKECRRQRRRKGADGGALAGLSA